VTDHWLKPVAPIFRVPRKMDHKSARRFVGSAKTEMRLQAAHFFLWKKGPIFREAKNREATKLHSGVRPAEGTPTFPRAATEGCSTAASKQAASHFLLRKKAHRNAECISFAAHPWSVSENRAFPKLF